MKSNWCRTDENKTLLRRIDFNTTSGRRHAPTGKCNKKNIKKASAMVWEDILYFLHLMKNPVSSPCEHSGLRISIGSCCFKCIVILLIYFLNCR